MISSKVKASEVIEVWTTKEGNNGRNSPMKAAVAKEGVVKNVDDDYHYYVDDEENEDNEDDDDDDIDDSDEESDVNEIDDEVSRERDKGNVSLMAGSSAEKSESSLSGTSEDTLFYKIMKEMNVEGFATLEYATPIVEAYA